MGDCRIVQIKSKDIKIEPIEKLVGDPKNENVHSEKQIEVLQKIIKVNGFREPLVVSNRSGYIVCGHGRLQAAKSLGMKELPVIYQDFENEAEETRHRIADNEIARHASLDTDKMISNLEEIGLELDSFDFEELGLIDFKLFNNDENKDKEINFRFDHCIEVKCRTENEQKLLYEELKEREFEVKILI